jgi:hypothetical protein
MPDVAAAATAVTRSRVDGLHALVPPGESFRAAFEVRVR